MAQPHLMDRLLWLETGSILGRWGHLWRLLASREPERIAAVSPRHAKPPAARIIHFRGAASVLLVDTSRTPQATQHTHSGFREPPIATTPLL